MSGKFEFYLPSSDGVSRIHGILEHIGRYDNFAKAMNEKGIAVIGHDNLGHGKTARPGCKLFSLYLVNEISLRVENSVIPILQF